MLATSIHLLRGTPYIYQGEEIGMTNCYYDTINSYRDVESINFYNILKSEGKTKEEIIKILQAKSRDNSRSPMQWDNSGNAGFTKEEPWIEICKNYKSINVENSLKDKDSIFYHYQTLIRLRKEYDIISYGNFELILEEDKSIFAYLRNYKNEKLLVINNFYGKESLFKFPAELKLDKYKNKILISNYKDSPIDFREFNLRPYESIVYHLERK